MSRDAVIITGGARRVGAAMARYFAKHGYDIALHYHHSEQEAAALKAEVEAVGVKCALFRHDLADIQGIAPMMRKIRAETPHATGLINNASVFERAGFMETDEALFDRQMDINLKAPFFLTQAFAKEFGQGSIINVLDSNIVNNHGSHFAYLLSKKSLGNFTKMAAVALGPKIRVNAIAPGCMLPSNENDAAYEQKMATAVPLKSHPGLDELSEAARWLMEQAHITGQTIFVDGGMHAL